VFRNRPVSLALVGLFVWLTACSTHTQIGIDEIADHGKVRVTRTDGERVTIRDPQVEADSIKGVVKKAGYLMPRTIPMDQLAALEAVGTDEAGTVFTVLGVFVGTLLLVGVVTCATSSGSGFVDPCG